jgi:hypothetical protein
MMQYIWHRNDNARKETFKLRVMRYYKLLSTFQSSSHERASRLQVSAAPEAKVSGEEGEQVRFLDITADISW